MTPAPIRRPVIVGVDGSDEARRALHWAAAEASRRECPLRVIHAVDFPHGQLGLAIGPHPADTREPSEARRILEAAVSVVQHAWPRVSANGEWFVGSPGTVLTRAAREADLVVVGSRGHGRIAAALVGSVGTQVAHRARCPVVVVRHARERRYPEARRGVVVGIDGSAASVAATEFAFATASQRGVPLTVVHVVRDPVVESQAVVSVVSHEERVAVEDEEMLDVAETIAGWRELYPDVAVVTRYENGRPAQVLADLSDGADLLVVGARARSTPTALLLGSVSRDVLKHAHCPVAIVRGDDRTHGLASPGSTQARTG